MKPTNVKLSELPEEVTEDGLKMYGPTSYETQVAILSHYLHTLEGKHDIASGEKRYDILEAIRDYIEYKRQQDKKNPKWKDVSDEDVWMAAESPLENDLFADFFKVPFPAPENPKFTLTYEGFKNKETESVLKEMPTVTTTAQKDSPVGDYEVNVSGAEAQNYDISYQNGVLTVTINTGDANVDGDVTEADVKAVVKHIMGQTPTGFDKEAADVNGDKKIDAADIVGIVKIIK